jgi:hypothetical protein
MFIDQLVCLLISWYILWPFGISYGHSVNCMVIWYIFHVLVCCTKQKSGNPGAGTVDAGKKQGDQNSVFLPTVSLFTVSIFLITQMVLNFWITFSTLKFI